MTNKGNNFVGDMLEALTAIALGFTIMAVGFVATAGLFGVFAGVCVNAYRYVVGD